MYVSWYFMKIMQYNEIVSLLTILPFRAYATIVSISVCCYPKVSRGMGIVYVCPNRFPVSMRSRGILTQAVK
jgi:hypothetical protein